MIRQMLMVCVLLIVAALLSCEHGRSAASPPAKKTAEKLANEWTFGPGKKKLQAWGSVLAKSGPNLVAVSCSLQDKGNAKEWFALAAKFYAEKCGSDYDQSKLKGNGKHIVQLTGESKNKGRYLVSTVGYMIIPTAEIPSKPEELLFAHNDADSTVTVVLRQQGEDRIFIVLTAAVR